MAVLKQMRLNSLQNSRKTLAKLIRERHQGKMDTETFRSLVNGMNVYLSYWKQAEAVAMENEILEIKEMLQQRQLL